MPRTTDSPSADHEMDNAYQNEFTEEGMPSPEQREEASHDLRLDPTTPDGANAQAAGAMPRADGGEPDFDDDVAAGTEDDDDDDEEEDATA